MPTTEHIHLPLYTDEETPDLSTTGHYNHAMEILDGNIGELEEKDAELAEDIADEREARIAGDTALDAKVTAEAKARADADTALDAKVTAETAAREAADNELSAAVGTKADSSALEKEVTDRKAADNELSAADNDLSRRIVEEEQARVAADNSTRSQIEGVESSLTLSIQEVSAGSIAEDKRLAGLIADETAKRMAQDETVQTQITATNGRIDNAEAEISANSADLTGIKGLTYGEGGQVFLENEDGEYSSPALEEIQHEISDLQERAVSVNSIAPLVVDSPPTGSGLTIGKNSVTRSATSTALGNTSLASKDSTAVGNTARASSNQSDAFGYGAMASAPGAVALGAFSKAIYRSVVSVGDVGLEREIMNVATPSRDTSAATKYYVDTAIAAIPAGGSSIALIDADTGTAAEIYSAIQAAWPNCVLRHGNALYLPANRSDFGYGFYGVPSGTSVPGYVVNSAGADEYNVLNMTGRATWGEIEQS